MFAYPKQAEFNGAVPKTKIYAHARPSKRVKELFVAQVGEILWKYKLSRETIKLPPRNGINEIQVFEIALRTPQLDPAVLQAIDKAVPFPLVFQLTYDGQVRFAASWKRPSEADASKWVIEASFQTEPQPLDTERPPLPVALDLAGLYEQIVRRHIPLSPRPGEGIADHVDRYNALVAKRKAQQQLEARLAQEKQFNRKVELNAQLRELATELASLQH
ncbi:MAG: methyl-accepting chemotaxis protein [Rhodocyclales bacterium RIFCSPLOWO2_02_FULL_63_24]|nr:MAG: methyl-accepting chemotaxis protein [Rhodocyclales bacterium RIFCSPLOWO2_02_FULL_63_24]